MGNRWVSASSLPPGLPALPTDTPLSQSWYSTTIPNRIASWGYDGNGNLLSEGSVARSFTYDAENRQVTACLNCSGSPTATYTYDGEGQRVSKTYNGQTTTYVYDAFGNLAAEYGGSSTSACGTPTCYVTTDHLGSTRLLTSNSGGVGARYDYEPFGQEIGSGYDGRSTTQGYTSTLDMTDPKFTGQMRDQETTLDWFNVRYYSSAPGRFQSPDPGNAGADPSNPQSWNGYAYVNNNPLSYTDPSGMMVCTSCVADESGNPVVIGIAAAIDIGELLAGLFEGLFGGGAPSSIAPSLATPSSPILQPSPDFDSQGWNEQIPDSDSGSIDSGTLFGSGNTSPFVFSWQQAGQAGGLAPGDVAITNPMFPGLVTGMHRAAGPVNAAFVATGVVASLPLAIPAAMTTYSAVAANAAGSGAAAAGTGTAVSRWGRAGLQAGDWVMKGTANRWNYLWSGKWDPGPWNIYAPFSSGQTFRVPPWALKWPSGWEFIKGVLGQRIYKP